MVVRMGRTTISGRQLLYLQEGDIILLDTDEDEMLEAEVEGVRKFYGYPGRVKGNKSFQVTKEEEIRF